MARTLRTLAIAAATSLGLVLYLILWFHWPVTLSLAVAALLGMLVVVTSTSLGEDSAAADAAWQAAAPDLLDQPGLALARSPSAGVAEGDEAADGDQGVDGMADSAGGAAAASGSADVIAASGAAASGASSGGGSFK